MCLRSFSVSVCACHFECVQRVADDLSDVDIALRHLEAADRHTLTQKDDPLAQERMDLRDAFRRADTGDTLSSLAICASYDVVSHGLPVSAFCVSTRLAISTRQWVKELVG